MSYLLSINKTEKLRNPNIDFIRVFGMLAIVIHHILWHGKILIKYSQYKSLQLLNIKCMWHVSSFGVISGLVGIKSHKYSNLLYLWFQSVFYSIILYIIYNDSKNYSFDELLNNCIFIVMNKKYWYLTAYFGIYPFLPFINSGISSLSRIDVKKSLYFMIIVFIILNSFINIDCFGQLNGKSPFSLLIFYVLGAYIGKYIFKKCADFFQRLLICIICFLLFKMVSFICYKINFMNALPRKNIAFKRVFRVGISSFPMIMQIFSIIIFIMQITFNQYISKAISFIATLTFDVYLIHENPYVRKKFIINSFKDKPNNIKISYLYFLIFKRCFHIFIISIFVGNIRNKLFNIMKIKKLCIYIEYIISKIVNFFI